MKRERAEEQAKSGKFEIPDDPVLRKLPRLAEAVADCFWDDGSARTPYQLSISWASGRCVISMNDKAKGRSVTCNASDLNSGLLMLEDLLGNDSLPWRAWSQPPQQGGRQRR